MIEIMQKLKENQFVKDGLNIILFVVLVVVGVFIINSFIFRSFNVEGPSMEKTMYTGDKLIVNKLPVSWQHLQRQEYIPDRGQVIVFKNPLFETMGRDEYIVKRVIGLPKEKVIVKNGEIKGYGARQSGITRRTLSILEKLNSGEIDEVYQKHRDNKSFNTGQFKGMQRYKRRNWAERGWDRAYSQIKEEMTTKLHNLITNFESKKGEVA
jgi:signal peptidase I